MTTHTVTPSETGRLKILVAYASRFGTTREVAEAIGETVAQAAHIAVETKWVGDVTSLDGYDAAVIGSAIQYDKWLPEATEFVLTHQNKLSQMPVAYFFTCMTLAKRTDKTERQAQKYADVLHNLSNQVTPLDIGRFAGSLTYRKLPMHLRLILRAVVFLARIKEGDYREWQLIRSWAKGLPLKLKLPPAQPQIADVQPRYDPYDLVKRPLNS